MTKQLEPARYRSVWISVSAVERSESLDDRASWQRVRSQLRGLHQPPGKSVVIESHHAVAMRFEIMERRER